MKFYDLLTEIDKSKKYSEKDFIREVASVLLNSKFDDVYDYIKENITIFRKQYSSFLTPFSYLLLNEKLSIVDLKNLLALAFKEAKFRDKNYLKVLDLLQAFSKESSIKELSADDFDEKFIKTLAQPVFSVALTTKKLFKKIKLDRSKLESRGISILEYLMVASFIYGKKDIIEKFFDKGTPTSMQRFKTIDFIKDIIDSGMTISEEVLDFIKSIGIEQSLNVRTINPQTTFVSAINKANGIAAKWFLNNYDINWKQMTKLNHLRTKEEVIAYIDKELKSA